MAIDPYQFYEENGYFIQENVLSPAECDALIEASKSFDNFKSDKFNPIMMPHRTDEIYLKAMANKKLVAIIEKLVGGKPSGIQTQFFYCKPGTRGFSSHQDNFYVEAPVGHFASAWIALTDTYAEKGGLIVWPGTHKEGQLPVRKIELEKDLGQDPNANNEECIIPEKYQPVNAVVPKGAALFIHGHVVHASNKNQTDQFRQVLLCTYVKAGTPFRPGNTAKRAEVVLEHV